MIAGRVNARHEIVVRLPIIDSNGQPHDAEFVLDTGFTGALTLPSAVIGALGLPWDSQQFLVLGNGQIEEVQVHEASIIWLFAE